MFNFLGRKKKKEPTIDWDKIELNELQSREYEKYLNRINSFELAPRQTGKSQRMAAENNLK